MKERLNTMLFVALVIVVVHIAAATAAAQSYACGSFTLPYEVEWRGETVPAGQYTFEVQHAIPQPIVILRNMGRTHEIKLIGSAAAVSKAPRNNSEFEILTADGRHYIRTFDISAIGASLIYSTPKLSNEKLRHENESSRITVAGGNREREPKP
jgi:hypothetical protein